MRSKVRQNEVGENPNCRNYFIKQSFCHTFPVIPMAQNYRECMETRKAIFRNSKEQIPSPIGLSYWLVYEGESIKSRHVKLILL